MKQILFTTILSLGLANIAAAQGALKLRMSDNSELTVVIDDRKYDKTGSDLLIGNLPQGRHYLKVYQYNAYRNKPGGYAKLVYTGRVRIEDYMISYMTVYNNGTATVSKEPMPAPVADNRDRPNDDRREPRYEDRDRRNDDRNNNNNNSTTRRELFTQKDMTDLQARVKAKITDSGKDELMRTALSGRSYTTEQVRIMLGWLSFDATKLDFAKWAYDGVTDQKNYWKLDSCFSFDSSKSELSEYIKTRR